MSVRPRSWLLAICCTLAGAAQQAHAANGDAAYGPSGFPALVTMPTALMPESGTVGVGVSAAPPYNTLYLSVQPAEWLHVGARYIAITDRNYDDDPGNGQSFKDKSFDVAVRALAETRWRPSVVFGLNDFGGTGLFASEYLVATKRFGDWSATLGLGFGRFGTAGDIGNPFASILPGAKDRELLDFAREQGGVPDVADWFGGRRASVIGGVEWAPRYRPWSFQIELDGNDYSAEPAVEPIEAKSRINFGMRYRLPRSWTAGVAYVRGDTVIGYIGIAPRLGSDRSPVKEFGIPAAPHLRYPHSPQNVKTVDSPEGVNEWVDALERRGIYAHATHLDEQRKTLTLWESNTLSDQSLDVLRVAGREALVRLPDSVERVEVVEVTGGLDVLSVSTDRATLDADARGDISVDELRAAVQVDSRAEIARKDAQHPDLLDYPSWSYGVSPALRTNIGGVDGFLIGQLLAKPFATLQLSSGLSMSAVLGINIANNFDKLNPRKTSRLPPVRSELELYQTQSSNVYLDRWEMNYLFPMGRDWFGRVSGGIFEEMYGGVAAEVLYRPVASRLAWGLDVNYVKKRDYDQLFEFLDYGVATGHLSAYYRTPLEGLVIKASAGRYLARDWGATLDISREFRNGLVVGAFATKTNVSSEDFGEGSFDKGIYLRMPLTIFYPGVDKGAMQFSYRFLTRDGGQKVVNGRGLYSVVGPFNAGQVYER